MEVSTMPPSLASPTKGKYLCGADVTNKAIGAITLVIGISGLVGNGAVLCFLGFFIRRRPITVYIFHMAITDSIFLFLMVLSILLFLRDIMVCSPPMIYPVLIVELLLFFYNLGLYLLTAISFSRCRSTFCPLWCSCHHPQNRSMVLSIMLVAISITLIPMLTSLFQFDNNKSYMVLINVLLFLHLLLSASPMVISSTILFIKVMCGSQQQQRKRLDIVIFLTVLSGLPSSLYIFLLWIRFTLFPFPVLCLLTCIHSTLKPLIYFLEARCWRNCSTRSLQLSLQRVFEEPEENTACSNDATMDTAL